MTAIVPQAFHYIADKLASGNKCPYIRQVEIYDEEDRASWCYFINADDFFYGLVLGD